MQHTHGNRAVGRFARERLQPKLAVGRVDDGNEREADRVAALVVRATDDEEPPGAVRRVRSRTGPPSRARAPDAADRTETPAVRAAPPAVEEALRSPGRPLDPEVRSSMETRFGTDFGRVRVHTDEAAARSAEAVDALAYTVGRDVVFGPDQYRPRTRDGRALLAHELTHVIQQGGGDRGTRETSPPPAARALQRQVATAASVAGAGVAVFSAGMSLEQRASGELSWERNIESAVHDYPPDGEPTRAWMRGETFPMLELDVRSGLSDAFASFDLVWDWNITDIVQARVEKRDSSDWDYSAADVTFQMQDGGSYETDGIAAMICYVSGTLNPAGTGDVDFAGRVLIRANGTAWRLGDLRVTRGDEQAFTVTPLEAGWKMEKR
jgi:hypothetical protein